MTSKPRILIVEDDPSLRSAMEDILQIGGYTVISAHDGEEALRLLSEKDKASRFALVLSDIRMPNMDGRQLLDKLGERYPRLPVLLMTAFGEISDAVSAIQAGASDYIVKPFDSDALLKRIGECLASVTSNHSSADDHSGMVAKDPATRQLLDFARRVSATDSTVLITGESGTGKEVMARYVHRHSPRFEKPFIAINCAAIPENMLEATLFGYEKGAFTGAYQATPGKFELAQGGTLLLDEITEMPAALQAKLLRVIQEREVERIGGRKTIKLDVRLLATSNRHMLEAVRSGEFREDLYFRLNVIRLELLPLRERPGDILPLAESILHKRASESSQPVPRLEDSARSILLAHSWPGNVRELGNTLERALVLHRNRRIEANDLMLDSMTDTLYNLPQTSNQNDTGSVPASPPVTAGTDLRSREQDTILKTLRSFSGRRAETAKHLGISPRTLRYKIARMRDEGIAIPGDALSHESSTNNLCFQ